MGDPERSEALHQRWIWERKFRVSELQFQMMIKTAPSGEAQYVDYGI